MITNLSTTLNKQHSVKETSGDVVVVCATDDAYAMPLAVTLHSAAINLRMGNGLEVFVMDGGIREENRLKLKETLANLPVNLNWVKFDAGCLQDLSVSHHVSHTAYFRLLLSEVLPQSLTKIVYLDSDLLVLGDLVELWEQPMNDHLLLAVPDVACPYVDAVRGMENFRRSNPYLATFMPVPNYRELGMDPKAQYFNSGVMVVDLQRWREDRLAARLLDCLTQNSDHVWCWDQYALNVELHGRWGPLPMQWNLGSHAFEFPSVDHSPVVRKEFETMIGDPKVVHFTTEWKPWHHGDQHPYRNHFFESLDKTAWKGWRPVKPPFSFQRSLGKFLVGSIKRSTIAYRRLRSIWS